MDWICIFIYKLTQFAAIRCFLIGNSTQVILQDKNWIIIIHNDAILK